MAKQQNNGQEQDVNQLRKVRRDKLAELQQNGKDNEAEFCPEEKNHVDFHQL